MSAQSIFNGKNIVSSLVVILGFLVYSYLSSNDPSTLAYLNQLLQPTPRSMPSVNPKPTSVPTNQSVAGASTGRQVAQVVKVVDGDTIDVSINGVREKIRIIGLNTPETVDPRKGVECFGREASNFAKQTLSGKTVYLEADPTQAERDKYNRLLRFVFVDGTLDFSLFMIQEGYGYEYTYDLPYKYQAAYKKAQEEAKNNKKGLWADNACAK
jgi:micrococcal nuclease